MDGEASRQITLARLAKETSHDNSLTSFLQQLLIWMKKMLTFPQLYFTFK